MIQIQAWKCDWCSRCFGRPQDARKHERACIENPAQRACKTCVHRGPFDQVIGVDITGREFTRKVHWCFANKMPLSDKPYYEHCDEVQEDTRLIPVPLRGSCKDYEYKIRDTAAQGCQGGSD